ncbi:C6 zinc finger domain-containingprotein [Purpureocillium lavendulum]|uniref:C6 zinc finger domain-containingprotein n=1 Tax=Purpureocillium lavendulum TaxID=1247861 RepID=A0AB34FCI0_9HYPO|nr:C6 zinc finger domain-containingprotein [Purpureocillium lavendulum]
MARSAAASPHIGIIGAGLSGLRCADILLRCGFKVTVVEGRGRVGGRLHQERLPNGHLVDLGPNWIHGTNDNPILDLAKQTNTAVGSWDTRSYVFDESGHLFQVDEGEKYANMMWGIIQDAFKHSNKLCATIDGTESLADFFQAKIIEKVPETESEFAKKRSILWQMSEMWGAFVGSPISRQSLKYFWLEECIEGENLFCGGTYKKVLDLVAQPVLADAEVLFNSKVTRIAYRNERQDQVHIGLEGGQTLSFDEVVVTCPLGWLQRNLSAFEPPLPPRLARAITSIGYGCLEKVYISFPKAFWLSQEGDDHKVQGFVQWLAPNYAPDSNPNRWHQEVVEMASLTPETSHPTLLFYIFGEQSKLLTSQVAQLAEPSKKDQFLYDFFRPYYSRLPHYSETSEDCMPTACLATDWLHDELAGCGSYSNFQVGLEEGDVDITTMREGLPNQGLWLAGEHTAPFVALGTATGAYWSGESFTIKNKANAPPANGNDAKGLTWLPGNDKIRGVNLGSQFIIEPWMAADEFLSMGCGGLNDEWSCVEKLGQDAANAAFKKHWDSWTTQDDIKQMASLKLNTVRIPVGFWLREDLVQDGEHFPRGGIEYLDRLVGWCKDAGLYVIMDLHGGPGAQFPNQQYTGHGVSQPGFYNTDNYERAAKFLEWMAERIHTNDAYSTVGMLEVMNEPVHSGDYPNEAADMVKTFYPLAWNRIRETESRLGVQDADRLHIQFMSKAWGSGDPTSALPSTDDAAFDDHRYYKWDSSVQKSKDGYIGAACGDKREDGVIVGEWSISVADDVESNDEFGIRDRPDQVDWYKRFWAAQVQAFEKSAGWVFWTWKCNWINGFDEWRWCYKSAVAAGAIPNDAGSAASISPC